MENISELKNKGLKSSAWNFFNLLANQVRNFIVTLILARLLTPADFGIVGMAMGLNSVLDFLADFGFSSAVVRKDQVTQTEVSTVFWFNVIIGGFCSLLVFSVAPLLAWFYEMPDLEHVVWVTSCSFFISSFGTLQTALFQRELDFRSPFKAKLISSLCSGVLGIVLAILDFGVWALVLSNLSGWLLYSFVIWVMSEWRPSMVFKMREVSDMISFGWKMTLSTFINRVVKQLDTLIIGKLYSAASLGLFNRAQSLNNLVIEYSFSSIRSVMLPSLSRLQNDDAALRHSVLKLLNVISFLTFLFSGLMYICAKDLIILLYGNQWTGAIKVFQILGLFSITLCLPVLFDTIMTVKNKMTMYLWQSVMRGIMVLMVIPIGIFYGFKGYVWAVSAIGVAKLIPYLFSTRSCIGLPISSQVASIVSYAVPFATILVAWHFVGFSTGITIIDLILKGVSFSTLYIGLNLLMKSDGYSTCIAIIKGMISKKRGWK